MTATIKSRRRRMYARLSFVVVLVSDTIVFDMIVFDMIVSITPSSRKISSASRAG